MTFQELNNRIKKIFILLFIILTIAFLFLCFFLFWPLSEARRDADARSTFEWVLFDIARIDPAFFKGDPVIKHKNGEKYYEWSYVSGVDTLAIGITVSKYPFENIYPCGYYIHDNADLVSKLYYTDPDVSDNKPINSNKKPL